MKTARNSAMLLILILILGLQGCTRTWFVNFTTADDIDDWNKQDWLPPYTCELNSDGLFLDGKVVTAPVGFNGDLTLIILFNLKTSVSSTVPYLNLVISGGGDAPYSEYISSIFLDLGNPSSESYSVSSASPPLLLAAGEAIPEMERTGLNTYKLVKKGSNIKVYINGQIICDEVDTSYSNDWYFPVLDINTDGTDQVVFKSIKVIYSGDIASPI